LCLYFTDLDVYIFQNYKTKQQAGMGSFIRYDVLKTLVLFLLTLEMAHSDLAPKKGMRTLMALYGAMCEADDIDIQKIGVKSYVQSLCDGKMKCSGSLLMKSANQFDSKCQDFYAIVVCESGEIRSTSILTEADGMFDIDCSTREIPKIRLNADWMGNMADVLESRLLQELRVPGSHDSASYSITGLLSHLAKTQAVSTGQQLLGGVRYLDFRMGNLGRFFGVRGTRINHGPFVGQLAFEDLLDIWAFVTLHPKELVILDIQSTLGLSADKRRMIFKWIEKLFKNVAIPPGAVNLKNTTLGDVWRSRRRILILSDQTSTSSLIWNRDIILNPWPNTCHVMDLRQNADRLNYDIQNKKTPHLSILQWVITAKLLCPQSLHYRSLAIKDACEQYLINTGFPFNIVLLDFIQEPISKPGLVELIIVSNRYR
jgi:hypothetical protein